MKIAFVLIDTMPAKERDICKKLKEMKETVWVYMVLGEYDIIAKIEDENFEKIGNIVKDTIREIEGVTDTKTLMVLRLDEGGEKNGITNNNTPNVDLWG
ncbi:MAG: Lrp/AsnC ligand binding domain-containing protein [Bacillota bacterium]